MKEFRVTWCKYPTNHNDDKVLFIEADSEADAKKIAVNHVERKIGISNYDFGITSIRLSDPVPMGRVIDK